MSMSVTERPVFWIWGLFTKLHNIIKAKNLNWIFEVLKVFLKTYKTRFFKTQFYSPVLPVWSRRVIFNQL